MDNSQQPELPLPIFQSLRRGRSVFVQDAEPGHPVSPPVSPPSPPRELAPAPVGFPYRAPLAPRTTLAVRPTSAPRAPALPTPSPEPEPIVIAPILQEANVGAGPVVVPRLLLLNGFAVPSVRPGPRGQVEITLFVTYHYMVPGYGVVSFHLRESRSIRLVSTFVNRQH